MGFLLCRFIILLPIFSARRSGSFPEQSNKMNERSVTWRQTNNAVYIYNRKQAGKPLHDWSYKKSPVTKVTGEGNRYSKNRLAFSMANAWYRSAFFRLIRASLRFRLGDAWRDFHVPRRRARFFRVLSARSWKSCSRVRIRRSGIQT